MRTFAEDLDDLITKHKGLGTDIEEMAADLSCAADGLDAEQATREENNE